MNPEIVAAVNASVARRDLRLSALQNQVGAAWSAVGQAMHMCLTEAGSSSKAIIAALLDAGRLLADIPNKEVTSRKELVSLNLNKTLKDRYTC